MKTLVLVSIILSSLSASAGIVQSNCKDSNFNGLAAGIHYSELKNRSRFTQLFNVANAPAPASFDIAGCNSVEASYLRHKASKKMYVVMTSNGDCDGGTPVGVVVDLDAHEFNQDGLVAEIGDGEVVCKQNI